MAFYDAPRTAPFGAISIFRLVSFFEAPARAFQRWTIARKTEGELSKLTDRELEDIGLDRGALADIASRIALRG